MKVYIAGPINGKPDGNRAAFKDMAERIRANGWVPVNPWDIPAVHEGPCIGGEVDHSENDHQYGCYLRSDIVELMQCDAICFLDGWEQSKGASTEAHVARSIGLKVVEV